MKLKTSFFDFSVLKKDLIRFWPVWGLYLIGGLLITQGGMAGNQVKYIAGELGSSYGVMGWINLIYAALIAILLFGDLFKAKMCNALHALPVRREAWFVSHLAAGILMCLVPNLVLALLLMIGMGSLWYAPLLWLGMIMLQFLFFFGAAVFSIFCTGNAFAAALVYAIINFVAALVMWAAESLYMPLLYGVGLSTEKFARFMPVISMTTQYRIWKAEHLSSCPVNHRYYSYGDIKETSYCDYALEHNGEIWGYLAILAAIGVVFLAVSLLLYRRRKLECAGDFAAEKPVKVVFATVGSFAAGMLFSVFGYSDDALAYILLFLGVFVGFFVCQMLLQRTVKVFGGKNWLRLGMMLGAVALSLVLTAVDAFGITRIVPQAEQVELAVISDTYLSDYEIDQIENGEKMPAYVYGSNYIQVEEPGQIREITEIHQLLIEEGDNRNTSKRTQIVSIYYKLKNGTILVRRYYGLVTGEAVQRMKTFTDTPAYVLGAQTPKELVSQLQYAFCYGTYEMEIPSSFWLPLAQALFRDAEAGNLSQNTGISSNQYIEMECMWKDGTFYYKSVRVPYTATETLKWLKEYAKEGKG